MNHTPHILASIFLCGLWLPIWLLIAATYNARFHCAQCGHSDAARYLANPYLRSQEHQRATLRREAAQNYFDSLKAWFLDLDTRAKIIVGCVLGIPVLFIVMIAALSPKSNTDQSKTPSNTSINKSSNATAPTPMATPSSSVSLKQNTNTVKTAAKQSCSDIESELAGVESEQANVEGMLDATEDFGDQAGSPKRAIYMNALKRKGELQLRHIALERKLRACGKRK